MSSGTHQAIELKWSPARSEYLLLNGYPGINQLYIGLPDGSLRQVAEAGDRITEFSWSADGDYLQYRTSTARFVVARSASGTDPGTEVALGTYLDWLPNGHRFLTYGGVPCRIVDASTPSAATDLTTWVASNGVLSPSGKYVACSSSLQSAVIELETGADLALTSAVTPSSSVYSQDETRLVYWNGTASYLVYLDTSPLVEIGLVSPGTAVHFSPVAKTGLYALGNSAYFRDISVNPPGTSLPIHTQAFGTVNAVGWSPDGTRILLSEGNDRVIAARVDGFAVSSPVTAYTGAGVYEWQPR